MTPEEIEILIQEAQSLIEQIRAETQKGGNTKERVANTLTKLNNVLTELNERPSGGGDIPVGTERQVLGYNSTGTPLAVTLGWKQLSDLPSPPPFSNGVLTGTAFQPDGSALFAFTKLAISSAESNTIPFYQTGGKLLVEDGASGKESVNYVQLTAGLANRYAITTTNITAPDATYQWMILTDGSGVTRRITFANFTKSIFEHNIKGKVLTATGVSGTYNCDLNAYTRWILTLTGNTTISFTNMILDDETITISMNVTGNFTLNFPSWLKQSPDSYLYDGTKVNRIVIEIGRGGLTPSGWYSITKFDS